MFFEGSEKKLEIVVKLSPGDSLRKIDQSFWTEIVVSSGAQILSSIHNDYLSAYLLSESSLFVWDDRIVMITCGETKLIQAVHTFLKRFSREDILSLIFQRKNEYCSHLQKTNFFSDIESLKNVFNGKSFRFGNTDSHHNFLYHIDREFTPSPKDYTHELLMYHLGSDAKAIFCQEGQEKNKIREFLKLNKYFGDWKIDDFVFQPYGYSLNAIKGPHYFTVHVTPQEEGSYASFETNIALWGEHKNYGVQILHAFSPESFDLVSFNDFLPERPFQNSNYPVKYVKEKLKCGYEVQFRQFIKKDTAEESAVLIP